LQAFSPVRFCRAIYKHNRAAAVFTEATERNEFDRMEEHFHLGQPNSAARKQWGKTPKSSEGRSLTFVTGVCSNRILSLVKPVGRGGKPVELGSGRRRLRKHIHFAEPEHFAAARAKTVDASHFPPRSDDVHRSITPFPLVIDKDTRPASRIFDTWAWVRERRPFPVFTSTNVTASMRPRVDTPWKTT
jgi:hypothetical protein